MYITKNLVTSTRMIPGQSYELNQELLEKFFTYGAFSKLVISEEDILTDIVEDTEKRAKVEEEAQQEAEEAQHAADLALASSIHRSIDCMRDGALKQGFSSEVLGRGPLPYSLSSEKLADLDRLYARVKDGAASVLWKDDTRNLRETYTGKQFTALYQEAQRFATACELRGDGLHAYAAQLAEAENYDGLRALTWDTSLPDDIESEISTQAEEAATAAGAALSTEIALFARNIAATALTISDEAALNFPHLFPVWPDGVNADGYYTKGQIVYCDVNQTLYRIEQDLVKPIENQPPHADGMLAVYRPISPEHAGTLEDPIPWVYGMDCLEGVYFSYNDHVYRVTAGGDMKPCVWAPDSGIWQWELVA